MQSFYLSVLAGETALGPDRFHLMVRERVCRFTVHPISPLLGHFGPEPTPATFASVAIDP